MAVIDNFDIHHVGYAVRNIEKAANKFQLLGYNPVSDVIDDYQRDVKIMFLQSRDKSLCIELVAPMNDLSPITETLKRMKNLSSPYHICYEVDNMLETATFLESNGFIATTDPAPAVAIDNRKVIFLINKEVGLIELVEKA